MVDDGCLNSLVQVMTSKANWLHHALGQSVWESSSNLSSPLAFNLQANLHEGKSCFRQGVIISCQTAIQTVSSLRLHWHNRRCASTRTTDGENPFGDKLHWLYPVQSLVSVTIIESVARRKWRQKKRQKGMTTAQRVLHEGHNLIVIGMLFLLFYSFNSINYFSDL